MNLHQHAHNRSNPSGYTIIDLFILMSGAIPASIVAGHFDERWRNLIVYPGMFVFGIIHWCLIFLLILPGLRCCLMRRPKALNKTHKDS